jgi:AmmeMemoRadiSam system protein A
MILTKQQSDTLLKIARDAIKQYLDNKTYLKISHPEEWMYDNRATFVTLKIKNDLRGCIGHLQAIQDVYRDVIDNAVAAAFFDPRFNPLSKYEFEHIHIEISILTVPELINYTNSDDLLKKIKKGMGIVISDGELGATFLPQVWDELPDKKEFLTQLCLKAGFAADAWQKQKLEVSKYDVEIYE